MGEKGNWGREWRIVRVNEELQETRKLWEKPQKWETIRICGETMSCGREWGIVKENCGRKGGIVAMTVLRDRETIM